MTNMLRKGQFYSVVANLVEDQDIKAKHLLACFLRIRSISFVFSLSKVF